MDTTLRQNCTHQFWSMGHLLTVAHPLFLTLAMAQEHHALNHSKHMTMKFFSISMSLIQPQVWQPQWTTLTFMNPLYSQCNYNHKRLNFSHWRSKWPSSPWHNCFLHLSIALSTFQNDQPPNTHIVHFFWHFFQSQIWSGMHSFGNSCWLIYILHWQCLTAMTPPHLFIDNVETPQLNCRSHL